jgi:hypothetical protein
MLDCLTKVQPGGTARATVTAAGSAPMQVVVEKRADKQVKVSFLDAPGG